MSSELPVVHVYVRCSTCREAVKWLRARGAAFVERPIVEEPPSLAELRRMLGFEQGKDSCFFFRCFLRVFKNAHAIQEIVKRIF